MVLAEEFLEDLGDTIMNLSVVGFQWILGIRHILGKR